MTSGEFTQLQRPQQQALIRQLGVFLGERRSGGDRVYLLAIHSFYVELLHPLSALDNNGIHILRAFEQDGGFENYQ